MGQDRVDYSTVTEGGSGDRGSRAQLARAYSRYRFALEYGAGRDVLEVACGIGQGLGLLAKDAARVVGLDLDEANVARARRTYTGRSAIEIVQGDAEHLPFADGSFDVVLLFEAIYYLPHPERFVTEAWRVLRPRGKLLICSANKDLPDFNPGAYTHNYFGPSELARMLDGAGFAAELFGEGKISGGLATRGLRGLKALAARLRLIPKTMRGKELIKRLVFGRLVVLPSELRDGLTDYDRPVPISPARPALEHLVIFAVGSRRE